MDEKLLGGSAYHKLGQQDQDIEEEVPFRRSQWWSRSVTIRLPLLVALVVCQLIIWIVLAIWAFRGRWIPEDLGYYPAAEAVRYYETTFEQEDIYKTMGGLPSNETDTAWKELQAPTDGVVQASQKAGFDVDILPITIHSHIDPSLSMYGLEAYHQLHCLDRIRKSFYPDHYFANETEKYILHHREHCIEHLRQSIMCSGDVAMDRWQYDFEDKKSYLRTDAVPHVCKDWSMLSGWVNKHALKLDDWRTN